ncbi:hypothetical protein IKE88_00770, partial [Candidatus Saccharibacteria bacterium]|nr:hypothetical protein [Candidatus Saccharibacteria bacterium]
AISRLDIAPACGVRICSARCRTDYIATAITISPPSIITSIPIVGVVIFPFFGLLAQKRKGEN